MNRLVGGGGQLAEEPVQIGARVDAPAQAAAKEAVEDGAALTGSYPSNEAPWERGCAS